MRGIKRIFVHCTAGSQRQTVADLQAEFKRNAEGKATDNRTDAQKESLRKLLKLLKSRYPKAEIMGHRDISPDTNGNGKVDSWERIKECPCFDAKEEYKEI